MCSKEKLFSKENILKNSFMKLLNCFVVVLAFIFLFGFKGQEVKADNGKAGTITLDMTVIEGATLSGTTLTATSYPVTLKFHNSATSSEHDMEAFGIYIGEWGAKVANTQNGDCEKNTIDVYVTFGGEISDWTCKNGSVYITFDHYEIEDAATENATHLEVINNYFKDGFLGIGRESDGTIRNYTFNWGIPYLTLRSAEDYNYGDRVSTIAGVANGSVEKESKDFASGWRRYYIVAEAPLGLMKVGYKTCSASSYTYYTDTDLYYSGWAKHKVKDVTVNDINSYCYDIYVEGMNGTSTRFRFLQDGTAPNIDGMTLSNSSNAKWTNQNVVLNLGGVYDPTVNGISTGVSAWYYSYDKSDWKSDWDGANGTTVAGTWSAERDNTVYFKVCDRLGNCAYPTKTTQIRIDKTKPSVPTYAYKYADDNTAYRGEWTNRNVNASLAATDLASGVKRYRSTYDKVTSSIGAEKGYIWKFTFELEKTVYYAAEDYAGNISEWSAASYIKIDKTAPTFNLSNTYDNTWTNQNVTVTASGGADNASTKNVNSGFNKYQYSTNNSTWSDTLVNMFTSDMNATRYYRACDNAGNCLVKSTNIKIDKTKPNGTLTISNTSNNAWTNQPVTITVSGATDTGHSTVNSGVKYYTYSYDNSTWADPAIFGSSSGEYNNANGVVDTWASEGNRKVYFRVCDNAGNCNDYGESYTTLIKIDTTAPSGTFSISNSSGGNWTNQLVTITVSGMTDPTSNGVSSGLAKYRWSDASGWYGYGTYDFYTQSNITNQSSGYASSGWNEEISFTLRPSVCDNAGNCVNATATTNIKIDTTAPGGTMSLDNTSGGNWTNQPVTITGGGIVEQGTSYLQSGMRHYRYSYDGTNWYYTNLGTESNKGEYNNANGFKDTWATDRDSTVYFVGCDNAGNCSESSSTPIKIDTHAPEGTISIYNDSNGNWTNQNVFVQVGGANDAVYNGVSSGLKQYDWSNGNGWNKFYTQSGLNTANSSGNAIWSGETDFTLTPRVCDNAGNCLVGTTTTKVRIDKTKPKQAMSIANNSGGNWVNTSVQVTLSGAQDQGTYQSGVKHYQYRYDTGSTWYSDWTVDYGANATGVWWASRDNYIYLRICDNAGNCSDESETYKTRIRIDTIAPNANITVKDKSAIINFTDNISITNSNSKIGSNYSYYMSTNSDADVAALGSSAWINSTSLAAGSDRKMNLSSGSYYLYIKVPNTFVDHVGNSISGASNAYSTAIANYTVFKQKVEIDKNNFTDTSSSVTVADINNKLGTANKNTGIQVYAMDRMIIVTFDSEKNVNFTMSAVNAELKKAGYNILTIDDSTSQAFASSYVYHNVLISVSATGNVSTKNELFDIVININAPVTNGNAGSSMHEVNEGEDIGNIAVSFTSDIEFTVDTVISLDGVRVNKIDTNKPGVYEVKHVAKDSMGRTNRVNKTVVVNPKNAETAEAKVVEEVKSVTPSASSQVKVTSETTNDLSINTIKANNANNVIAIIEKKDSKKRKEESEDEE